MNWIYNPAGKRYAAIYFYDEMGSYAIRVRDVDALIRAVAVQVAARRAKVGPSRMADFLSHSTGRHANPYTTRPFDWDADARQIWFKPGAERTAQFGIGGRKDRVGIRVAD